MPYLKIEDQISVLFGFFLSIPRHVLGIICLEKFPCNIKLSQLLKSVLELHLSPMHSTECIFMVPRLDVREPYYNYRQSVLFGGLSIHRGKRRKDTLSKTRHLFQVSHSRTRQNKTPSPWDIDTGTTHSKHDKASLEISCNDRYFA